MQNKLTGWFAAVVTVRRIVSSLSNVRHCFSYIQVFKQPWPGMMRTVFGDHQRFETTYFKKFPGYYTTGDGKTLRYSIKIS